MPEAVLHVLGQEFRLGCAEAELRRLEDLAAALEARLGDPGGNAAAMRRLVMVALSLMDEAQAAGAALARAHGQIERLSEAIVEAQIGAAPEALLPSDAGRVASLTRLQGAP